MEKQFLLIFLVFIQLVQVQSFGGNDSICFRSEEVKTAKFKVWPVDQLADCEGGYHGEIFAGRGTLNLVQYLTDKGQFRIVLVAIIQEDVGEKPKVEVIWDLALSKMKENTIRLGKFRLLRIYSEIEKRWIYGIEFGGAFFERN